jgi:hypothetical protein
MYFTLKPLAYGQGFLFVASEYGGYVLRTLVHFAAQLSEPTPEAVFSPEPVEVAPNKQFTDMDRSHKIPRFKVNWHRLVKTKKRPEGRFSFTARI